MIFKSTKEKMKTGHENRKSDFSILSYIFIDRRPAACARQAVARRAARSTGRLRSRRCFNKKYFLKIKNICSINKIK